MFSPQKSNLLRSLMDRRDIRTEQARRLMLIEVRAIFTKSNQPSNFNSNQEIDVFPTKINFLRSLMDGHTDRASLKVEAYCSQSNLHKNNQPSNFNSSR